MHTKLMYYSVTTYPCNSKTICNTALILLQSKALGMVQLRCNFMFARKQFTRARIELLVASVFITHEELTQDY